MVRMTSIAKMLLLASLALVVSASYVLCAPTQRTVVLKPGQNIQEIVDKLPQGTQFRFEPGIYRQQTIYPKDRQTFIGQEGVVLSGAMELITWTKQSELWKSELLPHPLRSGHGECEDGQDLCKFREDLFFNGQIYQRVASQDDLGPRKWYYQDRRAYLTDDPTGQSVELGVTPLAFGGRAEDVVLKNLIIEKYASDAQKGAIHNEHARGWRIIDVIARWNHGVGLEIGPKTYVRGGSSSYNGQLGVGAIGPGIKIEGVEISFNNYAGYDAGWEAGGTKFARTRGLLVRDSCVHHNNGPGLWTDIDNIDTVYEKNRVFMNANDGIKHEISYDAIIRNNLVVRNGSSGFDDWLWGSQIIIQNSSNVKVYGNRIEVSAQFGNGIGVIHQDRGKGAYGPRDAVNNSVHDNEIIHLGGRGQNGIVTDTDDDWFWRGGNNVFDRNSYIVANPRSKYWTSRNRDEAWGDIGGLGFEQNGELIVEQRPLSAPSCER